MMHTSVVTSAVLVLAYFQLHLTIASSVPREGHQIPLRIDFIPAPPNPEPIDIIELPLPPVAPNALEGSCTANINPRHTGCINQTTNIQSGSFSIDGNHVLVTVEFVGASNDSIYSGLQIILIKANGEPFLNGDSWKCLTCGSPSSFHDNLAYPQAFRDGKRFLAGPNIGDCGEYNVTSDECSPSALRMYPIHRATTSDPKDPSGAMRELRIHPDDTHLAWSYFTDGGQLCYIGQLHFNPSPQLKSGNTNHPRYDLININLLVSPDKSSPLSVSGSNLTINHNAITIGEVRGFSGTGNEVTYIGYPRESSNIDVFAIHLHTGVIRRLTSHPEYADPVDISPDDNWHVVMDTRGSGRQMFLSAMRGIPPITDLLSTAVVASIRNNGERRFFQPYLIDRYGDRGEYFGQRINAAGDGGPDSINDENWNGLADPKWSLDGTKIVYHQALVTAPACGGINPLSCPNSTAQAGRTKRVMLAHLMSRRLIKPVPKIVPAPDIIPWATRYDPSHSPSLPSAANISIPPGTYILHSPFSGTAEVTIFTTEITDNTTAPSTSSNVNTTELQISQINVTYSSFMTSESPPFNLSSNSLSKSHITIHLDKPRHILTGTESIHLSRHGTLHNLTWHSNLLQIDLLKNNITNTKKTSNSGFWLNIDIMRNIFNASRDSWLESCVEGVCWVQPGNGT